MTPKFDSQYQELLNEGWRDKLKTGAAIAAGTAATLPFTYGPMNDFAKKMAGKDDKPAHVRHIDDTPSRPSQQPPATPPPAVAGEQPATEAAPQRQIDWGFIAAREGAQVTEFYVPRANGGTTGPAEGRSGVTIASGFDIGQHSEAEIRALFDDQNLINRLIPFADAIQNNAIALLNNPEIDTSPLTADQVNEIDRVVNDDRADAVEQEYNDASLIDFAQLPGEVQTVIASVAFQYGNLATRTPVFWRQVTQGQWHEAIANLRNFGDRYPTRRNLEADLLERGIR